METTDYGMLLQQLKSLLADEPHWLPALSNASALLMQTLPELNWAGFYLFDGKDLVLGPFQGKVACIRIPVGKGVCGTAFAASETITVPDVHAFPGHIACDSASASEIVIPLFGRINGEKTPIGVLDIDSPAVSRFLPEDTKGLTLFARTLEENTDWRRLPWQDQHSEKC